MRKIYFQDQSSLNAGQKCCRMLPLGAFCNTLTSIKLPFVIKIFALSIFERSFYTGFTVYDTMFILNIVKHLYLASI